MISKVKPNLNWSLLLLVIFITSIPGSFIVISYWGVIQLAPEWTLSLYSIKKEVLSAMIAVVTTLMGFLAALVTLFFGLRGSKFFLKYEKAG